MDKPKCPHKHIARISSHADPVAAREQGALIVYLDVCGSKSCADLARTWVHEQTGRGLTYWMPLRDLED